MVATSLVMVSTTLVTVATSLALLWGHQRRLLDKYTFEKYTFKKYTFENTLYAFCFTLYAKVQKCKSAKVQSGAGGKWC